MLKILFVFGVIIIPVLFCVFSFFYAVSFYTKRNSVFNSRLTAVFSIPEDEENTEMVLRELVSYIKRNEMNCFRKIYIKTNGDNENVKLICLKMCQEYPIFELIRDVELHKI
ncbi:MAG: hypothetical protein E7505_04090 [Ruminococcus sp.]|nr:hypothetical protein [Ruminococcus sp.]